ncbi:MAG: response regulator [Aromatoleum sp.]|jgi:CheY-like chemotaxis protein|uniref:response regulator n=1 Tax=Aromatoleum sp. TaxID=2307007 RepID=UPI0028958BDD|nr:response regulator [Aromatoleum sp.]MDT3671064.1 response regulator [Aromatoleum sp.]
MPARILIAEDHPPSLELMRYLLGAHGYATRSATNGREAIDLARQERPDLVICDLQMPDVDGFAVVRELKQDRDLRSVPLLAVTAFSMLGDREDVLRAGFDGYFSKPIEPENFVAAIEQFLPAELLSRPNRGG